MHPLCLSVALVFIGALGSLVPVAASADPHAQDQKTIGVVVYERVEYDDNIFRLADSADAQTVLGTSQRSDRIVSSGIALMLDKAYGLQRLRLDASHMRYRYARFGYLDFSPTAYSGLWQWHLTPRLSGNVRADRQQRLTSFADYQNFSKRNIRTDVSREFDMGWEAGSRWRVLGSLSELSQRNSEVFRAEDAFTQYTAQVGLEYLSPAGNSLIVTGTESRGTFTDRTLDAANALDTRFQQNTVAATARWHLSAKSSIDAKLGYLTRQHQHFDQRDYSGLIGNVYFLWATTPKTQFSIRAGRDLVSFQNTASSYYVTEGLGLSQDWRMTDKTSMRLGLSTSRQRYLGAWVALPGPVRNDRLRGYEFAIAWEPRRYLAFKGSIKRNERTSSLSPSLHYSDRSAALTAELKF